jgi:hypothetical protein
MADSPLVSINRAAYCERLEDMSPQALMRIALDGQGLAPTAAETLLGITAGDIALQALELATKGYVSFVARIADDTNDTADIILSSRGVTFATGFARRVEACAISADGDNVTMEETTAIVQGHDTLSSAVVTYFGVAHLVTNGLTVAAVNPSKTSVSGLGLTGIGAQTVTILNSTGIRVRYTGQSSDVWTGTLIARVYPKVVQAVA